MLYILLGLHVLMFNNLSLDQMYIFHIVSLVSYNMRNQYLLVVTLPSGIHYLGPQPPIHRN